MRATPAERPDDGIERELGRAIWASETLRVRVILMLIVLGAALYALSASLPSVTGRPIHDMLLRLLPSASIVFATATGFEVLSLWFLNHKRRGTESPNRAFQLFSGVVEVTLATSATFIVASVTGPNLGLNSTVNMLPFLFMIRSILKLDPWVSVAVGAIAALEYAGIAAYFRSATQEPDWDLITNPAHHASKVCFLAFGGLAAGFVAREVRQAVWRSLETIRERDRAVSIFGQHVTPEVADRLLHQPMDYGGEAKFVCVMFLDIRGFSAFADDKSANDVMNYLNTLFEPMIDAVNRHRGIINKFLGDGFMAVFGAPVSGGDDCRNAVAAADEILSTVRALVANGSIPPTRLGIGLHAGEVLTGNVGSARRKEYTVIGHVVNVAARIEQCNKEFGSELLVSELVWRAVSATARAPAPTDLGPVHVKGPAEPVRLFRLQ
jgi:adenylate cyclase